MKQKTQTEKRRYRWKDFLFDLHLYLGLLSGVIVCLLCLTGTYLALQPLAEDWLNRDLIHRRSSEQPMPVAELIKSVADPDRKFSGLEVPYDQDRPWSLREGRRSTLVEPSTGEVLPKPKPLLEGSYRLSFRLHRWLLLDSSIGRPITGAATLIFILILLSGIVLWFQKTAKNRKRGLLLKRGVKWKRLNYDTHLVLGIYAALPLLVMALSGLFWSYRTPFVNATYRIFDGTSAPEKSKRSDSPSEEKPFIYDLPFSQAIEHMTSTFPENGHLRIDFPKEDESTFRVTKYRDASLGVLPIRDEVHFDITTGEPTQTILFRDKTRAERVLSLIKPIHTGEVNGTVSVLLYALCCLIGTSLPISGTIMWWNRTKKGRRFSRASSIDASA